MNAQTQNIIKKNDKNVVYKENSPQKNNSTVENNLIDLEESATQIAPSPKLQYSETVKTKQKLYDEYKMNSMTSLGKINNKNRTPPFDYWNTQKTPIHPEKKLRSSTPQNAIKFDHDRNSLERDLFASNYTLSPVPSKYLQPIDPHYQTNFPTANEAKEFLEINPKKQKKNLSKVKNMRKNIIQMRIILFLMKKIICQKKMEKTIKMNQC